MRGRARAPGHIAAVPESPVLWFKGITGREGVQVGERRERCNTGVDVLALCARFGKRRWRERASAPAFASAVPESPVLWSKKSRGREGVEVGERRERGRSGVGVFACCTRSWGAAVAREGTRSRFHLSSAHRSCFVVQGGAGAGAGAGERRRRGSTEVGVSAVWTKSWGGPVAGEGMRSRFRLCSARRSCLWSEGRERRDRGRGGGREEDGRQTAGVSVCTLLPKCPHLPHPPKPTRRLSCILLTGGYAVEGSIQHPSRV